MFVLLAPLTSALLLHPARPSASRRVAAELRPTLMTATGAPLPTTTTTTAELKSALVAKCDEFRTAQEALWAAEDEAAALVESTDERIKSPLKAEGFGNVEITTDETLARLRNETIALIEALSERNPTPEPFAGWRRRPYVYCKLDGAWKLLFTTGADATFRKTNETGAAEAFQEIDARRGHFVNCVDFSSETSKLRGFRVVVAGYPLNADEVQLKFRRVKLLRRSRWLSTVVIPLPPSRLLRAISRWASRGKGQLSRRGAGFRILYLDEEMRMHLTFDGQYFVQRRLD